MAELDFSGHEFNTMGRRGRAEGHPEGGRRDIARPGSVLAGKAAEQFRQFVRDEVAKDDRIVSQAGTPPE